MRVIAWEAIDPASWCLELWEEVSAASSDESESLEAGNPDKVGSQNNNNNNNKNNESLILDGDVYE